LAVKTVSINKGKKTSGIDGIIWNSPEIKYKAIIDLCPRRPTYKAKPLKRV